jgi:predicted permease
MTTLKEALKRMQSLFRKREQDVELDEEMQSHLEFAVEENLRAGMAPDEAKRKAMVRFGGVQQARERQREARGLPWLEILMQDMRFTFRTLRRDRAFAAIAIAILGLGIGANIAVFSVVDTVLLRPLPFPNSGQLVRIVSKDTAGGESGKTYSADATEEFQQRNHSFEDVTGYYAFSSDENLKMVGTGQPVPVTGLMVMGNFFKTLDVKPVLGRLFTPEESLKNSRAVTLLSYAFWKRHFGSDPKIVGQAINFSGTPTTVVGVLPETFDFGGVFSPGSKVDIFTPVIMDDIRNEGNTMALAGRLKPGVTVAKAQAEADLLFPNLDFMVTHPADKADYTAKLSTLKDYVTGKLRRSLIVLWCAVGVILLIVCVNLCNLLLARAAARSKEFALRSALGAGRMRLLRQLLTEAAVLAGGGAALGLGIAYATTAWLANHGSIALPLLSSVHVDRTALAWTLGIALLTAVLFGLTPAWKISHEHLVDALKDSGHGSSAGRNHERMRSMLVISEVALACVLLVGTRCIIIRRKFPTACDVFDGAGGRASGGG